MDIILVIGIILFTLLLVGLGLFFYSKTWEMEFGENVYVIKTRQGQITDHAKGGKFTVVPLIDEYFLVPLDRYPLTFKASAYSEGLIEEKQEHPGQLRWQITDPMRAFNRFGGVTAEVQSTITEVNDVLRNLAETNTKQILEEWSWERDKTHRPLDEVVLESMNELVEPWGICVENLTIRTD